MTQQQCDNFLQLLILQIAEVVAALEITHAHDLKSNVASHIKKQVLDDYLAVNLVREEGPVPPHLLKCPRI